MASALSPLMLLLLFSPEAEPLWAEPGRCGTNCLFVFLRLAGHTVEYGELARSVPVDGVLGTNLDNLARVARQNGVDVSVRKVRPGQIRNLPTPFVMHIELADLGGSGHFLTVYQTVRRGENTALYFIDGGTGLATRASFDRLRPAFTGFVLLPTDVDLQQSPVHTLVLTIVCALVAIPVGIAIVWVQQKFGQP